MIRVPTPRGDLGGQVLPALLGEVLLAGDEELGVGVELLELAGELLQDVVGHDDERLLDESRPASSSRAVAAIT